MLVRAELVATSGTAQDAQRLREYLDVAARSTGISGYSPRIVWGERASVEAAAHPADVVLNGITGSIGLEPTLTALKTGHRVALANKESLIAGGPLVRAAVDASPLEAPMVPVDSEHSALAQALASGTDAEIDRLFSRPQVDLFEDIPVTCFKTLPHGRRWRILPGIWGWWSQPIRQLW